MNGINWIGIYTMIRREMMRMLRVVIQTLVSPLISATLYIFIFGHVIGSRISLIAGVPYITFVFPGILMLNIIMASFSHASSSVYMGRFIKSIEEILIAPFSYFEIVFGFAAAAVIRSTLVAVGILAIGVLFHAVTITSPFLFLFYVVAISTIFALTGILVGLWANGFEQLSALNTFVITPLTYLGGIFYSISMLPPVMAHITRWNPFFYFADGIRHSMIGFSEANAYVGLAVILGLVAVLGFVTIYLFRIGWRIRS
ncbi:MAG TPA: ABC transporter permease [Candidatus Paceibacterota bacterium]|nr:ABC transporter permease [Candidatus Paceibacterota bacterium]